jgi:hypothetical protein
VEAFLLLARTTEQKSRRRGPLTLGLSLALGPALEQRSCVVCLNQADGLRRGKFWFLNENYSAGPVLTRLSRSQGFCRDHTRSLLRPDNRGPLTVVAEVLSQYNHSKARAALNRVSRRFDPGSVLGASLLGRVAESFQPSQPCPFCETLAEYERLTLNDLARFHDVPEVSRARDYLCVPHALALIDLDPAAADAVAAQTERRLAAAAGLDTRSALDLLYGRFPRPAGPSPNGGGPSAALPATQDLAAPVDACPACLAEEEVAQASAYGASGDAPLCDYHARRVCGRGVPHVPRLASQALRRLKGSAGARACALCGDEQRAAALSLARLAATSPEGLAKPAVCIRHLSMLLPGLARPQALALLGAVERRLQRLTDDCREYFRKTDYRYKDEPKGEEQDAWLRAAALLWSVPRPEGLIRRNE